MKRTKPALEGQATIGGRGGDLLSARSGPRCLSPSALKRVAPT